MKAMKILVGVALVGSVGLNVWLWQERAAQLAVTEAARAALAEAEALHPKMEALKAQSAANPATSDTDTRELARLRNQVGQLQRQVEEANALRAQSASEADKLRAQAAETKLRAVIKGTAGYTDEERELAATAKMSPDQFQALKERAQSLQCTSNLKQIGLAARLYAQSHGKIFPPDLVSMKDQMVTPKVLFCPAAPGGVQATEWTQLHLTTISYQLLNPGGNESDPSKPLATCLIHGHIGLSDGSVNMATK